MDVLEKGGGGGEEWTGEDEEGRQERGRKGGDRKVGIMYEAEDGIGNHTVNRDEGKAQAVRKEKGRQVRDMQAGKRQAGR